jgi:choline-sulfatase
MSNKPTAQGSFIDQYPKAFQPLFNGLEYHRFYYQLQKEVDQHIGQVMEALVSERNQYRDTIVIYLSDHGEMLGSHGGMFQKWHNAYDEILKVPMVFHNPQLFPEGQQTDVLTSHADLIPTMLGLAGADEKVVAKALRQTHNQVRPLVGRDLSSFLLGEVDDLELANSSVYFMTDDQPFRGANAVSALGNSYQPVQQPASVETVVSYLPTGPEGEQQRWKLSRYFDNPQFWSQPNVQDVQTFIPGPVNAPGTKTATTTVKAPNPTAGQIAPPADQYELYNPTVDPAELNNLYGNSQYAEQQNIMLNLLTAQRQQKRLAPTEQPWADGSAQQFPFTPN